MQNEWRKIYLCRQTVVEMLIDRGYKPNTTTQYMSPDEFKKTYPIATTDRNTIQINVVHNQTNEQLTVHFFDELKVGLKILKIYMESFERRGIQKCIFICREGLSPAGSKFIEDFKNVEVFKEKELFFNVTKHKLVPKHRILSPEEKENLLAERKIKEFQLPRITKNDPIARYFGVAKGVVFEILRPSETAKFTKYYRFVI